MFRLRYWSPRWIRFVLTTASALLGVIALSYLLGPLVDITAWLLSEAASMIPSLVLMVLGFVVFMAVMAVHRVFCMVAVSFLDD